MRRVDQALQNDVRTDSDSANTAGVRTDSDPVIVVVLHGSDTASDRIRQEGSNRSVGKTNIKNKDVGPQMLR